MNPVQQSQLQIAAFKSLFKSFITRDEISLESAFAQAIAITSDENFDKALKNNPELIEQWKKNHEG